MPVLKATNVKARSWGSGALISALALIAGCDQGAVPESTVQGAVTIDGELAPRGTVTFIPVDGGPVAVGRIRPDGSYSIRTGQGDLSDPDGGGIRSGEYIVTVSVTTEPERVAAGEENRPPSSGTRLMADKYAGKDSSGLSYTIDAGPNVIDLKLDGPSANPPAESAEADDAETESEAEGSDEGAKEASTAEGADAVESSSSSGSDGAEDDVPATESRARDEGTKAVNNEAEGSE